MKRRKFLKTLGASGLAASFGVGRAYAQTAPPIPPVAASAGYNNLVFSDEFDVMPDIGYGQNGQNGHKWTSGLWWVYPQPDPSCFSQANSALTITVQPGGLSGGGGAGLNHVDLCTQFHDHSGGSQFLYGYFEARICSFDWSAFWLFCWDRPTVAGSAVQANNPMTWTNEIDICEFDPGYPNSVWCTLHSNSSGDSTPDQINNSGGSWVSNRNDTDCLIEGYWHNYGLLWTPKRLVWYVDDIPIMSLPPYPSTNQPVQLILTAGAGGVNGSQSKTNPPETKIDWVRVWR